MKHKPRHVPVCHTVNLPGSSLYTKWNNSIYFKKQSQK